MKNTLKFQYLMLFFFETKQRNKAKKQRDKNKEAKENNI